MTFKPAHKDLDTPPGQVVNDTTLADYIERKRGQWEDNNPKKLSFEEWYYAFNPEHNQDGLYDAWHAGQENK